MMPFIFVFMRREKAEVIYRELNVAVEEIYTEYIYIYIHWYQYIVKLTELS